jgi:hypothetical protein
VCDHRTPHTPMRPANWQHLLHVNDRKLQAARNDLHRADGDPNARFKAMCRIDALLDQRSRLTAHTVGEHHQAA